MSTLRREAIQKVKDVLVFDAVFCSDGLELESPYKERYQELAERIVDALSNLRGFSMLKPFDAVRAGLDWAVAGGADSAMMSEIVDQEKRWEVARDAFESCLQIQLDWYPAKPSNEKIMKILRYKIMEWHEEDPLCFRDYQTWRMQEFVRGALSNVQIKSFPENFATSWSDFRRAVPLKVAKTVKTDDNDSPITY